MTLQFEYEGGEGHSISIQWYHNGDALVDGTYGDVVISGATTTTLTITNPTAEYDGVYFARVTDNDVPGCTVDTNPLEVTVPGLCRLAITVQPVGVDTSAGNEVVLTVAATGGQGTLTYQWFKDDVPLVDGASGGSTISGATTDTLTISDVEVALAGNYYVIITDTGIADCSVQSNTVVVSVAADCDLEITAQPEDTSLVEGGTLELTFAYTGSTGPFTVQWYFEGNPLSNGPSGGATISGATTTTLTITDWEEALAGSYYAIVIDTGVPDCQAQTATAVVTALTPPGGMYIWWKADGETTFSDGDVALPLQDFSGFDHDAVNGDLPHVTPTWESGILNGLPAFQWADPARVGIVYTDPFDLPTSGFPVVSTGYTFAMVINRTSVSATPSFNDIDVASLNDSPTLRGRLHLLASGGNVTYTHFAFGASTDCNLTVAINTWQIITGSFDFVEGIPRLYSNDIVAVGSTAAGSIFLNLAQMQGTSGQEVAELLYYNVKLGDTERDQLRNYLSEKWGIPITV